MSKNLVLGVVAIVVIAGGAYLYSSRNSGYVSPSPLPQPTPVPVTTTTTSTTSTTTTVNSNIVTVLMYDDKYVPMNLGIKQNDTVVFINKGQKNRWPASDIHPTHQIYPEFDPKGPIPPGSSWSFQFTKVGSWRWHDHLSPTMNGTIVVTQ